ncbi:MAG TPA: metallophosphoesterase [Arthrobacter sp.]|nr:metallophosphoesterase [Arthrobacter sp.]
MFGRAAAAALLLAALTGPPGAAGETRITYAGHVQEVGWQASVSDGATAGTVGRGLRLEALRFATTVQTARAHVQNIGWQEYRSGPATIGTEGQSLRMEAIQVRSAVPGEAVRCQAHVENIGWMAEVGDGEVCGTIGRSLRLEAVRLRMVSATPDTVLSTLTTVGDVGLETAGLATLAGMGAADPDLVFLLGDISYGTTAQPFCDAVARYIDEPFGWVQGNHETAPDSDGPLTADFLACLPATPNATGSPAIEQVISIPGARIITASAQEGYGYLPGTAALQRISNAIDSANAAGVWPILAFHEPHISVGLHGSSGPESQALSDLAIAKRVPLVLTSHDHNYSRHIIDGTTFIVAGMGGHHPRDLDYASAWWPQTVAAYPGAPSGWVTLTIGQRTIAGQLSGGAGPDTFTITR